jgi:hypothetical protein
VAAVVATVVVATVVVVGEVIKWHVQDR